MLWTGVGDEVDVGVRASAMHEADVRRQGRYSKIRIDCGGERTGQRFKRHNDATGHPYRGVDHDHRTAHRGHLVQPGAVAFRIMVVAGTTTTR